MTRLVRMSLITLAPLLIGAYCSLLQQPMEALKARTTPTPLRAPTVTRRVIKYLTLTPLPSATPSTTATRSPEDQPITGLAAFSSSPTRLGTTTNFSVTVRSGAGITFLWDFGDGLGRGTGPRPHYIYPRAGVYTATVTATNRISWLNATVVTTVTVGGADLAGGAAQTVAAQQTLVAQQTATAQATVLAMVVAPPTPPPSPTRLPSVHLKTGTFRTSGLPTLRDDDDDDDDEPEPSPLPSVAFSAATYSVNEAGGLANINVALTAPSGQAVTVNYATTSDGTATTGSDYTATNGTLTFAPGQTTASFTVPILNDLAIEPNQSLNLALSAPSNATLGSPNTASLTIVNTCTLPDAITAANTDAATGGCAAGNGDDTIDIEVTGTINLNGPLPNLSSNIFINGPGPGNMTIRRDTGGTYGIFTIDAGNTVTISGVTISNGWAATRGGGIYNDGSTLTVTNSTISGNSTWSGVGGGIGGGIYNSGTLIVINSTISDNSATNINGHGGGIANYGTLTIIGSTITDNLAGGRGGGININYPFVGGTATTTITNSIISGNSATNEGGGISSYGSSTVTLNNSIISGNLTTSSGGGFHNNRGTGTLSNTTINGNSASDAGGGIYNAGTVTLSNTTVDDNSASAGGGILNNGTGGMASITMNSSAISRNSASNTGGGIHHAVGGGMAILTMTNSTISTNSATNTGGGIYTVNAGATLIVSISSSTINGNSANTGGGISSDLTTFTLTNTIIANSPSGGDCSISSGTVTSLGYNLISDATCPGVFTATGDLTSTDPLVDPLQNNGGPTETHALQAGSPAIDAGSCPGAIADQRGLPRPVDRPEPNADDGCDIGAFEVQ